MQRFPLWLDPESKQSHPSSWAKLCKAQNKTGHVSGTSTFGLVGHRGGALFWQQICNLNFLGGSLMAQFQPGQPLLQGLVQAEWEQWEWGHSSRNFVPLAVIHSWMQRVLSMPVHLHCHSYWLHAVLLNSCVHFCICWSHTSNFLAATSLNWAGAVWNMDQPPTCLQPWISPFQFGDLSPFFLWSCLTREKQNQECWGTVISAGTLISNLRVT